MVSLPRCYLKWSPLMILLALSMHTMVVLSIEFEVGAPSKGWTLPSSKDSDQIYNQWASQNRFNVNDTVHFKYQKDSVLEVTEAEYEKCRAAHPMFFANNGDTVYTFSRPGLFYFISGVSGHCERGQKMIIKVLEPEKVNPSAPEEKKKSASSKIEGGVQVAAGAVFLVIMTFLGLNLVN